MSGVNYSVETINAAATAIVSSQPRIQPIAVSREKEGEIIKKRRWGCFLSLYWCFGSHKSNKRIGHAVLVPEPAEPGGSALTAEQENRSTAILLPFVAPPPSPASFLQSDPPSVTHTPVGLFSLTSLSVNYYSPGGPASIFAIGPYAYETQLVSPPVFSTYTTEPSTAPFTPPPESVQQTTPSSPEVPFARLLASSLDKTHGNSGMNPKFALTRCEFQPYQQYPGSPGGHLISPGSTISNSGTSSPFLDRQPILEFRKGEPPKLLDFEYISTHKWGFRQNSGSLTPEGLGLGSRLGSGSLTPDGYGIGSGSLTPIVAGQGSRFGSGSLTPDGLVPASRDHILMDYQISEVASATSFRNVCQKDATLVHHRVSFELTGEDVARCLANKSVASIRSVSSLKDVSTECSVDRAKILKNTDNFSDKSARKTSNGMPRNDNEGEDHCYQKHRSVTLGLAKEFNFDSTKTELLEKPAVSSEWWANGKVAGKESKTENSWSVFQILQPRVS